MTAFVCRGRRGANREDFAEAHQTVNRTLPGEGAAAAAAAAATARLIDLITIAAGAAARTAGADRGACRTGSGQ